MPTPLTHSVVGYLVVKSVEIGKDTKRFIVWSVFFSTLPDIDFITSIVCKNPFSPLHHRGAFHSLGAVFVLFIILKSLKLQDKLLYTLLYSLHIIMDFMSKDLYFPYGIMLLWPFSNQYYQGFLSNGRRDFLHDQAELSPFLQNHLCFPTCARRGTVVQILR